MTTTNQLYEVGGLPIASESTLVYPNNTWPTGLWGTAPASGAYGQWGYDAAVHVEDVGTYGTMVFGNAGEDVLMGNSQKFTMSADSPVWDQWEQPTFPTTAAQASSLGADVYYNQSDYNALASAVKFTTSTPTGAFVSAWLALPDGLSPSGNVGTATHRFPCGLLGWVFPAKASFFTYGNNRPWVWRYNTAVYIPPSMTGTGAGAILQSQNSHAGPWNTWRPAGVAESDWCADIWPSGHRRFYVHAQNTQTRAFTRFATPMPDTTGGAQDGQVWRGSAIVDRTTKRVYYHTLTASGWSYCYLDLTNGLASATWSTWVTPTDTGTPWPSTPNPAQQSGHVFTDGHPTGKRLWYMQCDNIANSLYMHDLATDRRYQLRNLPGMNIDLTDTLGNYDCNAHCGMAYDSVNNKVIITTYSPAAIKSIVFTVPTDPTQAANYSCTTTTLPGASGVSLEARTNTIFPYQDRCKYHQALGCILITQKVNKMLAYRPY